MTPQNIFCTAPWSGLTVKENGEVLTCCVGQTSLGNLNQQGIDHILQSSTLSKIKQKMLSGAPDFENCKECVRQQSHAGIAPVREHYNHFYPTVTTDQTRLQCLDIRWNNLCNLSCMYCTPKLSSTWQDRLNIKRSPVAKDYQDELLEWILLRSHDTKEITLVGGEPMLMKQNFKLIESLPDQCKISIITNLNYDLPQLPCIPKMLSRPKENTIWNVSLENTGKQFEYVRHGADWQQIRSNLMYLTQHWKELVSVNFVFCMFSAFDIVETVKILHGLGVKKITFSPINMCPTLDVFNMPEPIRLAAANQLQMAQEWHLENIPPDDRSLYPLKGLDAIIDQLSKPSTANFISRQVFFDKIKWYDSYNTQKFHDLWPNVIDLVEKYL